MRTIELREYQPAILHPQELAESEAEALWRLYHGKVDVEFPSIKTGGTYRLTPLGWVGRFPLSNDLSLTLKPKVPIKNIFRMLDYAYRTKGFKLLAGVTETASLEEVYEELAHVLARRAVDRVRKGLHRSYVPREERLSLVRGRMSIPHLARAPWRVAPHCHYEDHTADNEDNQILAWTLRQLSRMPFVRPEVRVAVRRSAQLYGSSVSLTEMTSRDCAHRIYSRLNQDYEPMHALCRFFLEHSGPGLAAGNRNMLPFLIDMSTLFEQFVAEWLDTHLPPGLRLGKQVRHNFQNGSYVDIDLVIYDDTSDDTTSPARCVLDTKYKAPERPSMDDINQVTVYALKQHCSEAFLVYPTPLPYPFDETIRDVRVRSVVFDLERELEEAGQELVRTIHMPIIPQPADTK